jgi:hypothetical protein
MRGAYGWGNEVIDFGSVYRARWAGLAKVTTTLQTAIDILIPSNRKLRNTTDLAWKQMVIPNGAVVDSVSVRLPRVYPSTEMNGLPEDVASPYWINDTAATLVGTTGEHLKVAASGTNYSSTDNQFTASGSAYTLDAVNTLDLSDTLGADTTYKVYVSNAASNAAGNGIRISSTDSSVIGFILVEINWSCLPKASRIESYGFSAFNEVS